MASGNPGKYRAAQVNGHGAGWFGVTVHEALRVGAFGVVVKRGQAESAGLTPRLFKLRPRRLARGGAAALGR